MTDKISIINMSCPMPKMEFDIITLGHGSGGLLTNQLLESGVFKIFGNPILDQRHDGAIIDIKGKLAVSTDSFVVSPVFFPGGNIGDLAINGTVNDINMCGAKAKYMTLSFIIEEGLSMQELWDIMVTIKVAADDADVQIVTGDTKVVEKGKGDKIFINTTGIGEVIEGASIALSNVKAGDKIIVSNTIANHGIAIMSIRDGLEFETKIVSDTCHFNHTVPPLVEKYKSGIHLLKDPTRGGLASVLNEVARDTKLGIDIFQKNIPIESEVEGACELLGLDPLYVANEGVYIAIVEADRADEVLQDMRLDAHCSHASIIGQVTTEHAKQVLLHSAIGGKRVVNMILGEQLPRIC
jgi:hydrogenase expression/formation protein HypE